MWFQLRIVGVTANKARLRLGFVVRGLPDSRAALVVTWRNRSCDNLPFCSIWFR